MPKKRIFLVLLFCIVLNSRLYILTTGSNNILIVQEKNESFSPSKGKMTTISEEPNRTPEQYGNVRNNLELNFITTYHPNPIDSSWSDVPDPIPVLVEISSAVKLNVTAYQNFENITVVLIEEVPAPLGDNKNFLELANESIPREFNVGSMNTNESKIITWNLYALKYPPQRRTRLMTAVGKNTVDSIETVIYPQFIEFQLAQIHAPKMTINGTFSSEFHKVEQEYELTTNNSLYFWFNISSIGLTSIMGINITITNKKPDYIELASPSSMSTLPSNGTVEVKKFKNRIFEGRIEELPPNHSTTFNFSLDVKKEVIVKSPVLISIGHNLTSVHDYNYTLLIVPSEVLSDEEIDNGSSNGSNGTNNGFLGTIVIYFIAGTAALGFGGLAAMFYERITKKKEKVEVIKKGQG